MKFIKRLFVLIIFMVIFQTSNTYAQIGGAVNVVGHGVLALVGGGREAWGFGSMTLGNAWAFPAASQEVGLGAMRC